MYDVLEGENNFTRGVMSDFSDKEIVRLIDLAIRRMSKDRDPEDYSAKDQRLYEKMRDMYNDVYNALR